MDTQESAGVSHHQVLEAIRGVRVHVCGDTLIDSYLFLTNPRPSRTPGNTSYDLSQKWVSPGGAANVACYAAALGAMVTFHSIFHSGASQAIDCLEQIENLSLRIVRTKDWRNPIKTRSVIDGVVRMQHSYEPDGIVPPDLSEQLVDQIVNANPKVVALADYGRGAVNYRQVRRLCDSESVVLVDPHKRDDWSRYDGAWCIKGSHLFFGEDYGRSPNSSIRVITHAEQGSRLWTDCFSPPIEIPAIQTRVADTTGAGDCYLASMACCAAAGIRIHEACQFASLVSSISVERMGTTPVYPHEIIEWMQKTVCS